MRIGFVVALTLVLTVTNVWLSKIQGRLACVPFWDDLGYFLQATCMLEDGRRWGWHAFLVTWLNAGFHAPLQSLLAAGAYALAGYREDAPYYANGLWLGLFLAGLAYFLRRWPTPCWALALLGFAATPLTSRLIVEFRPDPGWGVVLGFAAVYSLTSTTGERTRSLVALLFGLALWTKPAAFVVTLPLFAYVLVTQPWPGKAALARQLGLFAVVTAPLWTLKTSYLIRYFWDNWFGRYNAVWRSFQIAPDPLTYYLWGEGGQNNLGQAGLLPVVLLLVLLARHPRRRTAVAVASLLVVCYAIPTISALKTPFLAAPFYASILFAAAERLGAQTPRLGTVGCGVLLMWAVWSFPPESLRTARGWQQDDVLQLRARALVSRISLPERPSILFGQGGPVFAYTLALWVCWQGKRCDVHDAGWDENLVPFKNWLEKADLVFIQPPGMISNTGFHYSILPGDASLVEKRQLLLAQPGFTRKTSLGGVEVYLRQPTGASAWKAGTR